ncbi:general secretion pathway protein GspD [Nostoc sp. MBR 210]|nr:general secretion pathway protein GspD [Nostoc sp. MBR 210]
MKQLHGNSLILGAAALTFLAAQPGWAQVTQVNDVKLNAVDGGINVVLKTSSTSRPQVFTTKRGKTLVSDVINAQLRLPGGTNFRQDKPASGISSVEVVQLDANSIRVIVTGDNDAPSGQPVLRKDDRITLGFTPSTGTVAATPTTPTVPATNVPVQPSQRPDVLVPNPEISIDGRPAQAAGPGQPVSQAPPFLPRAVAPPVGDIAVSATDASPTIIDLGTQERVPRLVLRDAPVRDVLSLLARAANLNLAYVGNGEDQKTEQTNTGATEKLIYQKVSLDIENEPVQDVFNYVLRLSGLEANRSGRTIFVGPKLPNSTRDVVVRNLRLNQAPVKEVLRFLVNLGAESAVNAELKVTRVTTQDIGQEKTGQTQVAEDTNLTAQRITFTDSNPILRGLQVLGDERTNSVTLIGLPKLVDIAMAQIIPLDIRRRQVAVNVKIVDVNLLNTHDTNTSFSFGVGNNFFTNDGGAAVLNFGGSRPATSAEVANNVTGGAPVTANPLQGGNIFLNTTNPNTGTANAGVSTNPLQPGLTGYTQGTPGTITSVPIEFDPVTGQPTRYSNQITGQTPDRYTYGLPSLFQFPKRLLASLQAQITSGNAKILTDPTLIVQEGQTADVQLTQEVVGNVKSETTRGGDTSVQTVTAEKTEVGLRLIVRVDRIDDNGFVVLSVSPSVSSPQASAQLNTGGSNQTIFLVSKRSLTSGLIRLRDGQTLILSGIIQDSDRVTVSKIPILGDLPLIGSLFRRTNKNNQRNEVIVLLTPQVMDDSENSSYGYNYTPSPEVRNVLERRGFGAPKR